MNKNAGYILALLLGLILGYFAGREHLKYEMRSALLSAAEGVTESLSSAFGGSASTERRTTSGKTIEGQQEQHEENAIKAAYIDEHLELYDVSAKYRDSMFEGKVPGVLFKLRNSGERSLDRVEVTIYFKDANGSVIAEENFVPVSTRRFSDDNLPLKAGYIWEMERNTFYPAKRAPTEWEEGSIEASITDIRFTE